jgi:two-component system, sensor histidine kinase and response regulator
MPGSYDHLQVFLSVVIAIAASYAALDLAGRVTAASGWARSVWLTGGAVAMGIGIWSMHFTGMLAFHLPVPVGYDWPTVLLSLLAAILSSVFALYVASRQKMGWVQALASSITLGVGIAGMHYLGMASMRLGAVCQFNPRIVTLSVVLAIVFSVAALLLAFDLREETKGTPLRKIASAALMGAAISGMHYTGMASASFIPFGATPNLSHTLSVSVLGGVGIVTVTLIILGVAVLTSAVDRRFAAQSLELALAEAKAEVTHVTRIATMGELVATIAHEVNQPLTAIVTYAGYCLRELAGETPNLQKVREAIGEIANDANRASAVISRIRALLMKGTPDRVKLDINEVIHEVTLLMHNEVTRNRISLRTDLAANLPRILGDRVQLQQVLINLIMNSIDAMRTITDRPRELLIKSGKNPDGVLILVQDSGSGLDPDQADRIFEPFFTTKPQGIGMGLSISLSIIESHGGRLWAESGSKGALFHFTLPTQD